MIFYGKRFGILNYKIVLYVRLPRNRLMYFYQSLEELLISLYSHSPNRYIMYPNAKVRNTPKKVTTNHTATHPIINLMIASI